MKYAFFGTPEFAARILRKLLAAGMPPDIVVCNPDRPVGRKKILTAPRAKQVILEQGSAEKTRLLQPEKLTPLPEEIVALKPDFFVVASYAKILKPDLLAVPRLGTIGVHPSLLPKFRGASPIQSTILEGVPETGVALYHMGAGVDDGPVFKMESIPVLNRNYLALQDVLADLAGDMLVDFIPRFAASEAAALPQDDSQATLTRKFTAEDGFIPFENIEAARNGSAHAAAIERKIRALNPEPGVWTEKGGRRLKLLAANLDGEKLRLGLVQWEGKTPEPFRGF